jgi:hypothetical protein
MLKSPVMTKLPEDMEICSISDENSSKNSVEDEEGGRYTTIILDVDELV